MKQILTSCHWGRSSLQYQHTIDAGSVVTLAACDGVIIIRPVSGVAETYTLQRKAEFLLSNAVDAADYAAACEEVRKLGLQPADISHQDAALIFANSTLINPVED